VLVVGAGPAGLAVARELGERGIGCRVLERGPTPAHVWHNLYDSLRLHTGRHLSTLPGLRFPRGTSLFPSRDEFVDYLERYRSVFDIDVATDTDVLRATPSNGHGWVLQTSRGVLETGTLVIATGIVSWPVIPRFEGEGEFEGRLLHSVEYRRPDPFRGRRVLVVGCGNSGGEIASELADHAQSVTVAIRTGANVVPLTIAGLPIQYLAYVLRRLPAPVRKGVVAMIRTLVDARRGPPSIPRPPWGPLDRIPLIGFHLADAIRDGRVRAAPGIARLSADGARFIDGTAESFDDVILATGFRPALQPLGDGVRTDEAGFALRVDRVRSADRQDLFFVGHNYDSSGGIQNIARDAVLAAEQIA
jgi:lysine/ornithine N-monooxygenase